MLWVNIDGNMEAVERRIGGWQVGRWRILGRKCECGEKACRHVSALVNAGLIARKKYRRPKNCVDT